MAALSTHPYPRCGAWTSAAGKRHLEQWSYERIRSAAEEAQRAWVFGSNSDQVGPAPHPLPYVPRVFHWYDATWQGETLAPQGWRWGDSGALGVLEAAGAVLREALSVTSDGAYAHALTDARRRVGTEVAELLKVRHQIDDPWLTQPYLRKLEPNTDYWTARTVAYERAMDSTRTRPVTGHCCSGCFPDKPGRDEALNLLINWNGDQGLRTTAAVEVSLRAVIGCRFQLQQIAGERAGQRPISGVERWTTFLFAPPDDREPGDEYARVLLRMLALDAGTRLLADGAPVGAQLPVRLGK